MEKIFIRFKADQHRSLSENLNILSDGLLKTNEVLQNHAEIALSNELAQEIISKGDNFIAELQENEKRKLKKLGNTKFTCEEMSTKFGNSLREELSDPFILIRRYSSLLPYFSFYKNGKPFISDEASEKMRETYTVYADTPKKIEIHNLHREAAVKINELRAKLADSGVPTALSLLFSENDNVVVPSELSYEWSDIPEKQRERFSNYFTEQEIEQLKHI